MTIYNDAENSWSPTATALDDDNYWIGRHFGNEDYFYVYSRGWVISSDCIKTIRPMNIDGLFSTTGMYPMVELNDTLFMVQGSNGIWKRPVSQISAIQEEVIQPDRTDVYPNPADEYFNITGLPSNQDITISVTDLTGRRHLQEEVSRNQRISIHNLDQGIYFVQIRYGKDSVVKKMVIVR
jgi:hypothetical protein